MGILPVGIGGVENKRREIRILVERRSKQLKSQDVSREPRQPAGLQLCLLEQISADNEMNYTFNLTRIRLNTQL